MKILKVKNVLFSLLATLLLTVSVTETTLAQITTNNGYLYFQNSNQSLHGNNATNLTYRSGHSATASFPFHNKTNTRLGAVYGSANTNGKYFGLLDADGNWAITIANDSYTAFKINNKNKMVLRANGQLDITGTRDASGTSGSGVLEIGNALRLDNNEIITNTGTALYLNNDNNGDLVVDANTLRVDASTNRVGIGTTAPAETLHVNGAVRGNQSGALRINTGTGYVDIGPKNTSIAHINTDRPRFISTKKSESTPVG